MKHNLIWKLVLSIVPCLIIGLGIVVISAVLFLRPARQHTAANGPVIDVQATIVR